MVTFDNEEIKKHIAKLRVFSGLSIGAFLIAFCCGMFAATAAGHLEEHAYFVTASWIIACVAASALIGFFILFKLTEKKIEKCVIGILVAAMEENCELLTGDSEIVLIAEYKEDKVTLYRQNSFKEIVFDLSGIEKSTRTYSAFGTRLWQYLEGFYFVHYGEGYSNVTVTDKPEWSKLFETLPLVSGGAPCCSRPERNYFLKRGLIK